MMAQTLDQLRAQFAWGQVVKHAGVDGYREMTKGAPALIMGSGLMAAVAYWQSRSGSNREAALAVEADILGWLAKQKLVLAADFGAAMAAFSGAGPLDYMRCTAETLAMLKWLRQFADAVEAGKVT